MNKSCYRSLIIFTILFTADVYGQTLNWIKVNSPPFKADHLHPFGKTLFAPTNHGLYNSVDSGITWIQAPGIVGDSSILLFSDCGLTLNAVVPIIGQLPTDVDGTLFQSDDEGKTWNNVGYHCVGCRQACAGNIIVDYGSFLDNSAWLSSDRGSTWQTIDTFSRGVWEVAVSDSLALFLSTSYQGNLDLILLSVYENTKKYLDIFDSSMFLTAIDKNIFYARTKSGFFRSTNKGINWGKISDPILIWYLRNDTIIATTKNNDLIISINDGTSWHPINNIGLPNTYFYLVKLNKELYAELPSGDIYRTTFPEISSVNNLETSKDLFSIYPNPISSSATISYSLPVSGKISIDIYDLLGRKISDLILNEFLSEGLHDIQIDTRSYTNGIYTCRFHSGWKETSEKFVVFR